MIVLLNTKTLKKDSIGIISDCGDYLHYTEVNTFKEASDACRTYIETLGLGSSCFTGGAVMNENKEHIADVAYNGKVFDLDHKLLYNPYE